MEKQLYDPTLRTAKIMIGDRELTMCFDLRSLGKAEAELLKLGYDINLYRALPAFNLSSVQVLFAASLRRFHPEIAFDQAIDMLTLEYLHKVGAAVTAAWTAALPGPETADEGEEKNPTTPGS